jgi:hypothetical protein
VPGALKKKLDGEKWPAILGNEPFLEWIKRQFISKKNKKDRYAAGSRCAADHESRGSFKHDLSGA